MVNQYLIQTTLGITNFAVNKLCRDKLGKKYVMKQMNKKKLCMKRISNGTFAYGSVLNELAQQQKLEHPNVNKIREVIDGDERLYIVSDWFAKGSLKDLLQKQNLEKDQKVGLPLPKVKHYLREMLRALDYCHSMGVFHLDFKPENIMINQNDEAVLANFGFSSVLSCYKVKR